ncbi:hypothetical protein [Enterovibrio calviensis]|uniref:hypothetical protein n=1 Tax=Enterovibrio calviensis TaxID=91359 RepID=UPI003735901F
MSDPSFSKLAQSMTFESIRALNDDMATLATAVEQFPKELDSTMQKKVNRLIDITQEIEFHATSYRNALMVEARENRQSLISEIIDVLPKADERQSVGSSVFWYVLAAGLIGGVIGASLSVIALHVLA